MTRSKKLLLTLAVCVLPMPAPPAHARATGEPCRTVAVAADSRPALVLRNPRERPLTLSLSFQPRDGAAPAPLSCRAVSLAAHTDTRIEHLAAQCPGLSASQAGVLTACVVASTAAPPRGASTGDLFADLMGNDLPVAGR